MTRQFFRDNGRGRVLAKGVVQVSYNVTLKQVALVKSLDLICSLFLSFLTRVVNCTLSWELLEYLTLEAIMSVRSFPRAKSFVLISRSRLVLLIVWLPVFQPSCGICLGD
jgi:hypothetical protein